jgi:hypothetical protein
MELNWIFHRRDIRGFAQELANPQLSSPCNFQVNQSINLPSIIENNHLEITLCLILIPKLESYLLLILHCSTNPVLLGAVSCSAHSYTILTSLETSRKTP